jgi:hypothetical protein
MVLVLLGSFSVPEITGVLAVLAGAGVIMLDYIYG